MFDLIQIPVVANPVSRIRYSWEGEEFKRFRFNLLWETQSRAFKYFLVFAIPVFTTWMGSQTGYALAIGLNILWSVPLAYWFEKRKTEGGDDTYEIPKSDQKSPVKWIWYGIKIFLFTGYLNLAIAKILSTLRWGCSFLPSRMAKVSVVSVILVSLTLTGIRASHQILHEAGFAQTARISWNVWGRFLNGFYQIAEAIFIRWFWGHLFAFSMWFGSFVWFI